MGVHKQGEGEFIFAFIMTIERAFRNTGDIRDFSGCGRINAFSDEATRIIEAYAERARMPFIRLLSFSFLRGH